MTNNRNPYELRMDIISMAVRIERERFQTEKDRYFKGLTSEYPEYPKEDELFSRINFLIKMMEGKNQTKG